MATGFRSASLPLCSFLRWRALRVAPPLLVASLLTVSGSACAGDADLSQDPIPVEQPPIRPMDDLLALPEFLEVLELQTRRDGAGLVPFLTHGTPEIRARAALALASVQDPEQWEVLRGLLADPEESVRRDAAFALGQIPQPDGGAALLEALEEEGVLEVRLRLIEALGKRGGELATGELLEVEVAPEERAAHLLALGRLALNTEGFPPTGVVAHLARNLYSGDERVREAAAYYFGRSPNPQTWLVAVDVVREAMEVMALDAPALMHLAAALGRLRDPGDGVRLTRLLEEAEDWRIRANAARGLAAPEFLEAPGTREALWRTMESDPYEHVVVAAAESLTAGFQVPEVVLERAAGWIRGDPARWRSHFPFLRPLATAGEGEAVVAWTRRQAREGEVMAVVRGLEVVGAMNGPEITDVLFEMADHSEPEVRGAAVASLAGRWPREFGGDEGLTRYVELFAREVEAENPLAAASAARALGHPVFHPYGSVQILRNAWEVRGLPALRSEEAFGMRELPVLEALLEAMGDTGDSLLLPILDAALSEPDYRIRRAAAAARRELTGQQVQGLELPDPERRPDAAALAALGPEPELVLDTSRGRLVFRLLPDQAPLTVTSVAEVANTGAYDGTRFHRVIPNFVAQGGDVGLGDGTGGPGYAIPSEFTQIPFQRGVIGMASAGKDTEGSQFYLTHSMQPHLDGAYTAFGWVISGEDVLDRILEGDRIEAARVRPRASPGSDAASGSDPDPGDPSG
jgi:cyclophilin family peptidyl-prolyl cis-trans isomerase/HEAT repeat protein